MGSREPPSPKESAGVSLEAVRKAVKLVQDTCGDKKKTKDTIRQTALEQVGIMECEFLKLYAIIERQALEIEASKVRLSRSETVCTPVIPEAKSYASAAAKNMPLVSSTFDPLCTVQVAPKNPNDLLSSEATKQFLKLVDITSCGARIEHMKSIKNHGVSVLCRSRKDAEALKGALAKEKSCKALDVKVPERKNPTLSMLLPGRDYDDKGKLMENIFTLNRKELFGSDCSEDSQEPLKWVHSIATKNGNTIVILEATPRGYQRLVSANFKLHVFWEQVTLREQDPVSQCYKCWKFGHKAKHCKYAFNGSPVKRCKRCGATHDDEHECTASPCCPNCNDHNRMAEKRRWRAHPTDHVATDPTCPFKVKVIQRARNYIDYGDSPV